MDKVVRRHKTLGAWVPVWVRGPCRNPGCADYGAREAGRARVQEDVADPERVTTAKESAGESATDAGGTSARKT